MNDYFFVAKKKLRYIQIQQIFLTIKELELMLILRKFNNSNNKLLFLDKLTHPQYISEIIVSTIN